MLLGFNDEPDFINEQGTKYWVDKPTTQYAQRENLNGVSLDMVVYLAETENGYMARLLIDKDQNIIAEEQNLEQLAVKIDMLKANIHFDEVQK